MVPASYNLGVPIFEFRCDECGERFATLVGMVAEEDSEACPKCGSPKTRRLVSRVAKFRPEDQRVDEIADRLEHFGEPGSSSEMRSLVRELGSAMDEDMADEMEEMLEGDLEGSVDDD